MKTVLLSVIGLLCALRAPAHASAPIELRPEQLTIRADRGDTVTRTLQLRLNEEVFNLRAQPMELLAERHGGALPAQLLKVTPAPAEAAADAPTDAPAATWAANLPPPKTVVFTLTVSLAGVPAGEYSGVLPFTYQGGELKLPLKISVRHGPPLPLAVLVCGILASMALSAYRARGRPRDQVVVRLGLMQKFVQRDRALSEGIQRNNGDPDLDSAAGLTASAPVPAAAEPTHSGPAPGRPIPNPFKARILAALIDVELCLQSERWDEARTKMDEADALLRKWIGGRLGWIYQIAYLGRLDDSLSLRSGRSRFLQAVRSALTDLIANAPAQPSPQTLRESTQRLTGRLSDYQRLDAKLQILEGLRPQLPADLETAFALLVSDLRARLESLRPEAADAADAATLAGEIDQAIKDLLDQLKQSAAAADRSSKSVRAAILESHAAPVVEPVPDAHLERSTAERAALARDRLRWFVRFSYLIALGLLAGSGFNEIYAKNLTFGADLWVDYLALVLWGFGAEATRDSVASTLRSLGLPLDGRNGEARA